MKKQNTNLNTSGLQQSDIARLANKAMTDASTHIRPSKSALFDTVTGWLENYSLSSKFTPDDALAHLVKKGVNGDAIIDHIIPNAARALGQKWADDTLGFSDVTIGTSHLHLLLKRIINEREQELRDQDGKCVLVVVFCQEQHTLGALVLTDKLRRLGLSVKVEIGTTQEQIVDLLQEQEFDAVLFSSAENEITQQYADCIKSIHPKGGARPLFALGGPILYCDRIETIPNQFDVATNDLDVLIGNIDYRLPKLRKLRRLEGAK